MTTRQATTCSEIMITLENAAVISTYANYSKICLRLERYKTCTSLLKAFTACNDIQAVLK